MMASKYTFAEKNDLPNYLLGLFENPRLSAAVVFVVVGVIALIGNKYREAMPLLFQSLFVGIGTSIIFFLKGAERIRFFKSRLIIRSLNWLGMIAFSLCLVHAPILELGWVYLMKHLHLAYPGYQSAAMVVLCTAFSIMVAWVFFYVIEKPCHICSKSIKKLPS